MEPRSFERGELPTQVADHDSATLQWSHVLSNVESSSGTSRERRDLGASMEPRSFERGEDYLRLLIRLPTTLQWSHVLSNVERTTPATASSDLHCGFNGATFFRTWRVLPCVVGNHGRRASMEPRSFERGELKAGVQVIGIPVPLQWSHVLSNVEREDHPDKGVEGTLASMEPRSFERGELSIGERLNHSFEASMEPRSFERGESISCSSR